MDEHDKLAGNLAAAFGLRRMGIAMMRQALVRRHPGDRPCEIDARLAQLLLHRPEAEHGDGVGTVGNWPRRRP